jgi:EAL domain-containing protein (putative c-di-GMP-specific phosphodiesterase class I)
MYNQGAKGYQETLLVDTLDRMRRNPEGRKVVHLHLSQLMPSNRTSVRIKIVTRMFRTMESGRSVQIFSLSNDDVVMIVNAGAQRDVNNILHRIRKLYEGDPITAESAEGDKFTTWYDLSLDAAMAVHSFQQMRQDAQAAPPKGANAGPAAMTPQTLDEVQKKLAFLNIAPFIRDQVALRINPATKEAAIEFYEFFLSVGDIQRTVAPNINVLGDRWLFQDLSRTMDLRMLETVVRSPLIHGTPCVSLNLNLDTVLTPSFGQFIERIDKGRKVIVEIQLVDLLTNFNMYLDVRNVLNSMGHAILIDGLSTTALQMLDVAGMKPDYAKIIWARELLDMMDPAGTRSAQHMVQEIGAERVILSRVDSPAALAWGLKSGISLFQGHFLDSFNKMRKRPAPPPSTSAPAAKPAFRGVRG